jgi:hypothetical protein
MDKYGLRCQTGVEQRHHERAHFAMPASRSRWVPKFVPCLRGEPHKFISPPADSKSFSFPASDNEAPSLDRLSRTRPAQLERRKGIRFPAFYKEFLSMYGPGDFGCVTVLSPEPESGIAIWETTSRLENRERMRLAKYIVLEHMRFLFESQDE